MSISSAQSALKQIEREIERLSKTKSDAEAKAAKLEKQITDKQREIEKATNTATIRSKQSQLKSLQDNRDRAKREASEAGSKLVRQTEKKHKAEADLRKEEQKENDRQNQQLQRTINDLSNQLEGRTALREPNMIMQCIRPLIARYPDALALFDSAAEKYVDGGADRNALDDMRLCFEKVLQAIFSNDKSIENQMEAIGGLLKGAGVSNEFRNLLNKALDYYTKYQNNHVKHDDSINPYEVSFVVEFTCILIKQMIEQFGQDTTDIDEEEEEVDEEGYTAADREAIRRLLD